MLLSEDDKSGCLLEAFLNDVETSQEQIYYHIE